jgi:hypothetical protein
MLKTNVVEKIGEKFMFNNCFYQNRAVYEIIWINKVEPETPPTTI